MVAIARNIVACLGWRTFTKVAADKKTTHGPIRAMSRAGHSKNQRGRRHAGATASARTEQLLTHIDELKATGTHGASVVATGMTDARDWTRILNRYREPSRTRSLIELAITLVPLAALWIAMWAVLHFTGSYWLCLLIAVPAAGFLVRLFMFQHDCGHGAFFPHKHINDWIGRVIGVFTMTPYDFWRRTHSMHHASSGNLDRRGMGDIDTLTVREYLGRSRLGRLQYRLYRHPLVMFGIGPAYLFVLQHRLPVGLMRGAGWLPWVSAMATNAAMALIAAVLIWFIGLQAFLLVHIPVMLLAASMGVWLFYVQHQFEETSWNENKSWDLHEAALHGSSHYALPHVLRWFTANIGIHHVHHLCSRIPYYRLPRVLRDYPELGQIGRLTLMESFACVRLVLWDEDRKQMVSFRQMAAARA